MLRRLEETVCRMEGNRCIIVSKIYVYFTRTYQIAAKLTQKLKYTCEHNLITVAGWKKNYLFRSISWCQYLQKHTRSPKEISVKRRFEHLFMYLRLMKKQYWLSVISKKKFYLHQSFNQILWKFVYNED
jgi:hypothetical protein